MATLGLIFIVAALILFALATFWVPNPNPNPPRINLIAGGLTCLTAAILCGGHFLAS